MELRKLDKPLPAEDDPDNGTLIDKGLQRRQIQPLRQPIARRQQQKDQNERFEQSQQSPAKFVDQRKELYLFRKKGSENAQEPSFVTIRRIKKEIAIEIQPAIVSCPIAPVSALVIPNQTSSCPLSALQNKTPTATERIVPASLQTPAINPRRTPNKIPMIIRRKNRTSKIQDNFSPPFF